MNRLEIINFGLTGKLAVDEIATYDSTTAQGRVARALYPHLKEKAIESFGWHFARVESAALAALAESEEGNERYQLPNGWEMITRIYTDQGHEPDYRIVGDVLELTEEDKGTNNTLHIEYIKNVDEGKYPAYFGVALAVEFAAAACMVLTENATLRDALEVEAEKLWRKARRLSKQVAGNEALFPEAEHSIINNRRG